jgi:hypothetical protein
MFVAPRRVEDLTDGHLRDVARNQPIDEARGIRASDEVFEQRRDVDQRRRVADGVVLVLVMPFIRAHGVVPGPLAVVQALAERKRALMNRRADRHCRL